MSGIRHVAAGAHDAALFLTAEFERHVRLWSFADRTLVADLDTVLDFGGERLALCGAPSAPVIVAGAWERHGICGYTPDGSQLWQRKDLRQPQHIAPAADGSLVVACFDERPMHVLSADSGETLARVRAVRGFYDNQYAATGLGEVTGGVVLVGTSDWQVISRTRIKGFAVLSAAGGPAALAFGDVVAYNAEGQSTVSCMTLDGEVVWVWSAPPEVNCPALAWDDDAAEWVGVLKHVNNKQPDTLVRWSADGEVVSEHPLGLFATRAFLPDGRHLVTSAGTVLDTRTGTVVWELPD